jgi:hypothetical protein
MVKAMKNIKSYARLFWKLFVSEMVIFKDDAFGEIINANIWAVSFIAVAGYLFPKLGMDETYGSFLAATAITSCAFFEVWTAVTVFVADICGRKSISYQFTLPLPTWLIFIKNSCVYATWSMVVTIVILPLGKLILLDRFDLSKLCVIKFITMFFMMNFFIGIFAVFVSSLVKTSRCIGTVWMRIIFPMWVLSGSQVPWNAMHEVCPTLAYIDLINPLLYPMEGVRGSILGYDGCLPFSLCFAMIIFYGFVFSYAGIWKLRRRLDFV